MAATKRNPETRQGGVVGVLIVIRVVGTTSMTFFVGLLNVLASRIGCVLNRIATVGAVRFDLFLVPIGIAKNSYFP